MKRPLGKYGLAWVLLSLFLASWALQTWTGWREFRAEQLEHEETAQIFGDDGYIWNWSRATFENWQSEFLQVLAFVTLTSFLIFKGSPESRDGDDEMQAKLDRIEKQLKTLSKQLDAGSANGHPAEPVKRLRVKAAGD